MYVQLEHEIMAQLTINLPDDIKREFKLMAQQHGVDMTTILKRHIYDVLAGKVELNPDSMTTDTTLPKTQAITRKEE